MSSTNKNKHFTLEERRIILTGVTNGSTKVAIAKTLGKEKSTIGKEIKLHHVCSNVCLIIKKTIVNGEIALLVLVMVVTPTRSVDSTSIIIRLKRLIKNTNRILLPQKQCCTVSMY